MHSKKKEISIIILEKVFGVNQTEIVLDSWMEKHFALHLHAWNEIQPTETSAITKILCSLLQLRLQTHHGCWFVLFHEIQNQQLTHIHKVSKKGSIEQSGHKETRGKFKLLGKILYRSDITLSIHIIPSIQSVRALFFLAFSYSPFSFS